MELTAHNSHFTLIPEHTMNFKISPARQNTTDTDSLWKNSKMKTSANCMRTVWYSTLCCASTFQRGRKVYIWIAYHFQYKLNEIHFISIILSILFFSIRFFRLAGHVWVNPGQFGWSHTRRFLCLSNLLIQIVTISRVVSKN